MGILGHNKSWGLDEEDVILVDVGGGHGHVLEDFRKQRPDIKGRVIVQDLPEVIEGRVSLNGVEVMAYNLFTAQPVRGIRVFFLSLQGSPVFTYSLGYKFHTDKDALCHRCPNLLFPPHIPQLI